MGEQAVSDLMVTFTQALVGGSLVGMFVVFVSLFTR
jgi:hypothetical protein